MLEVLVGVVVLVFIVKSGLLTNLSVGIAPGAVPAPVAVAPQTAQQVAASLASNTQQETAVASGIQQGGTSIANSTLNSLGASTAAVPVVGAIFSILASSLIAASQKRAQEAKSENAAVATGVPAWDAAIAQVVAAYNNGSITNVQAQQLFTTIQSNYWNEVGPQIQPGRNGCNSGANCPPSQTPNSSTSINAGGNNYCSGNIGAACCVGCADLQLSIDNMNWAVNHATATGTSVSAFVQVVFASKYGGVNRPSYTVTFIPPAVPA